MNLAFSTIFHCNIGTLGKVINCERNLTSKFWSSLPRLPIFRFLVSSCFENSTNSLRAVDFIRYPQVAKSFAADKYTRLLEYVIRRKKSEVFESGYLDKQVSGSAYRVICAHNIRKWLWTTFQTTILEIYNLFSNFNAISISSRMFRIANVEKN
mgnify:CR=1 FL=1